MIKFTTYFVAFRSQRAARNQAAAAANLRRIPKSAKAKERAREKAKEKAREIARNNRDSNIRRTPYNL